MDVCEVYKVLHGMPETAHQEYRTSAFLAARLRELGFDVAEGVNGSTGVVGTLDSGRPGPVLGLRADMDALPFEREGKPCAIHACGHDANCAMVLTAAGRLARKNTFSGTLQVIFQPAEEGDGGSRSVIGSGLLSGLDEIAAIHLLESGDGGIGQASPAVYHCASSQIRARLLGVSAHGSKPHLGINAAEAAVLAANGLSAVHGDPALVHSLKVTQIITAEGGVNTIPAEALIGIDLRCEDDQEMERLAQKVRKVLECTAEAAGAGLELQPITYGPAPVYSQAMRQSAADSIREVLGVQGLLRDVHTTVGEDFHYYAALLGCEAIYMGLGADVSPVLHHPDMCFDVRALEHGSEILSRFAEKRLCDMEER